MTEVPLKCENGLQFAPLFFLRFLLGKCYYRDRDSHVGIYRYFLRPRMIAIQKSNGAWHIRTKCRLIYSAGFILSIVERRNREAAAKKAAKITDPDVESDR